MVNGTCLDCFSIIPKCEECAYSKTIINQGIKLDEGAGSLTCSNCGYYNYLNTTKGSYKCSLCKDKFTYAGCASCGMTGQYCTKCMPGYLGNGTASTFKCYPCSAYLKNCAMCYSTTTCDQCFSDYYKMFGVCFKKWF